MTDLLTGTGLNLGVAQALITTLATVLTIGIAFLVKPGLSTLYWSFAFTLAMLATYGVVAAEVNDMEALRRASLGELLGAPAFLWSGFRAAWGLRPHVWAGAALAVVAAVGLATVDGLSWFTLAYRTAFFAASVFAGLFVLDWARAAGRRNDKLLLPLAIVSVAFFVTGTATLIAGIVYPPSGGDDFALVRLISSAGMLVYVACALIAVVGTAARDSGLGRASAGSSAWQQFEQIAGDRLLRAAKTSEAWSIVYLQLDDALDIRQTAGAAAFAELSEGLAEEVRAVFPAESDVGTPSAGAVVVLVPRSDAAVRDLLRTILERVTLLDVHGALPIRPTASAGWAPASVLGYDLDALVYTGREAARFASEKGGDRWERVGSTIVERLISRSELS
jgi:GGDEF domain-containing protein